MFQKFKQLILYKFDFLRNHQPFNITLFYTSGFDYVLLKKSSALSKSHFLMKLKKNIDKRRLPHYIPQKFLPSVAAGTKFIPAFLFKIL